MSPLSSLRYMYGNTSVRSCQPPPRHHVVVGREHRSITRAIISVDHQTRFIRTYVSHTTQNVRRFGTPATPSLFLPRPSGKKAHITEFLHTTRIKLSIIRTLFISPHVALIFTTLKCWHWVHNARLLCAKRIPNDFLACFSPNIKESMVLSAIWVLYA